MALINRETDYAIRILRSVSDGKLRSITDICIEQEFTKPFAYKIVKKLEKAGFVGIVRGKQGGVKLDCDLDKKSLYDIMAAVDNVQYINDCFKPGYKCEFSGNGKCGVHNNLKNLQDTMDRELKACRMTDLI